MHAASDPPPRYELRSRDRDRGSSVCCSTTRIAVLAVCVLVTLLLGWQTTRLELNASFEKTIPQRHAYIQNYQAHKADLVGLGNAVRIAVANPQGTIYDAAYLDALRKLSDEIFLIPGVNRCR
jgi:predicted RND superfamily exporter protein